MSENLRVKEVDKFKDRNLQCDNELKDIVEMAAEICGTPIALLTLIDLETQWVKVNKGFSIEKTSRDVSFCTHAIQQSDIFIVEDPETDHRFKDNPLVIGPPHIRFYAGFPMQSSGGYNIGSLCVMDHKPGKLNEFQTRMLKKLSSQAMIVMELKSSLQEINRQNSLLQDIAFMQAHQLRGPLTTLMGVIDLIKAENYQAPKEYYKMLDKSITNFDNIIRQIVKSSDQR